LLQDGDVPATWVDTALLGLVVGFSPKTLV
jgi:UDP-glucuronate 4-epimerase